MDNEKCHKRININTDYLFNASLQVHPTAMRIYFLLLSMLTKDEEIIFVMRKKIADTIGVTRRFDHAHESIRQLEEYKLITRPEGTRNRYQINTEYARLIDDKG